MEGQDAVMGYYRNGCFTVHTDTHHQRYVDDLSGEHVVDAIVGTEQCRFAGDS